MIRILSSYIPQDTDSGILGYSSFHYVMSLRFIRSTSSRR
nr:MAG TPA: hypothetical protein [Caudoviricetes sp.]